MSDINGDSQDERHEDEIDVVGVQFALSNPADPALGGGGAGTGKTTFSSFNVVKMVDRATPELLEVAALGRHLAEARIQICPVLTERPECFVEYRLGDVVVLSAVPGVVETVGLSFATIREIVTTFNADGTVDERLMADVDLRQEGGVFDQVSKALVSDDNRFASADGVKIFVRIDGLPGGSRSESHRDWIDAASLSGGAISRPALQVGGGGAGGLASFSDVVFTKAIDKASPELFQNAALGRHLARVDIEICSSSDEHLCNVKYRLEDVLVNALSVLVSLEGATETVGMKSAKICVEVRSSAGGPSGVSSFCFDRRQNQKF